MALIHVSVFLTLLVSVLANPGIKVQDDDDVWTTIDIAKGALGQSRISANLLIDPIMMGVNYAVPSEPIPVDLPSSIPFIKDCELYGVSGGFERDGDATADFALTQVTLSVALTNKEEMGLLCKYKILLISGELKLRLENVKISAVMKQTIGFSPKTTLEDLKVEDAKMKLKVTGMGPMNWVMSLQFRAMSALVQPFLMTYIENAVKDTFNESIG